MVAACGGDAEHRSRATGASGSDAGGTSASGGSAGAEAAGGFPEFTSSFDTTEPLVGIGLWMGLGEQLPIEMPPVEHDGTALHLVGDAGMGLDVFFHTPLPVERLASEVKFSAYSPEGDAITVGIAGPNPTYFSDHEAGVAWPEKAFEVGSQWRSFSFSLDELSPTPPHEEMFGAVHFVVQPGVPYDFWIDDFTLVSRSR
jgi:hypothetical protein